MEPGGEASWTGTVSRGRGSREDGAGQRTSHAEDASRIESEASTGNGERHRARGPRGGKPESREPRWFSQWEERTTRDLGLRDILRDRGVAKGNVSVIYDPIFRVA